MGAIWFQQTSQLSIQLNHAAWCTLVTAADRSAEVQQSAELSLFFGQKRLFCKLPGLLTLAEMQLHMVTLERVWLHKASMGSGKDVQMHVHSDDN